MRERSRPATLTRSPTKSLGKTPRLLPTLIKIVSATEGSIVTRGDFSFFRVFYFFGVFQYSFFPNKKSADSFRTSHIAENVSSEGSAFP